MPAVAAGRTSLSRRSPTYATSARGQREPFGDRREEPRIGLLDAQRLARGDEVERHVQPAEQRLGGLWLVAGHADAVAGPSEALEGGDRIRIQVVRTDDVGHARTGPLPLGLAQVQVRPAGSGTARGGRRHGR